MKIIDLIARLIFVYVCILMSFAWYTWDASNAVDTLYCICLIIILFIVIMAFLPLAKRSLSGKIVVTTAAIILFFTFILFIVLFTKRCREIDRNKKFQPNPNAIYKR
jgi:heme A synthase